jgi:hypothetical protein
LQPEKQETYTNDQLTGYIYFILTKHNTLYSLENLSLKKHFGFQTWRKDGIEELGFHISGMVIEHLSAPGQGKGILKSRILDMKKIL